MAKLYADEDFPLPVVQELRRLGHDGLTVQEARRAGQGIDDADVLADAISDQRAVVTHNHADFKRLHGQGQPHEGIIYRDSSSFAQPLSSKIAAARRASSKCA